jgi:hypothetical protein
MDLFIDEKGDIIKWDIDENYLNILYLSKFFNVTFNSTVLSEIIIKISKDGKNYVVYTRSISVPYVFPFYILSFEKNLMSQQNFS